MLRYTRTMHSTSRLNVSFNTYFVHKVNSSTSRDCRLRLLLLSITVRRWKKSWP